MNKNNNLKVVSLFSGIGGFESGFENSNLKTELVFSSEIDKYAGLTYGFNFNTKNMYGDIKKIDEKDIPSHDLLCGGFPCQTFSLAGKQKGFEDIRGTLFFDIIRIIKEKKPKYILLENVKNLISHDGGNTIKTILTKISECNYTFDITVISSSEAGLPQNRERTYILGVLNHDIVPFIKDKRNSKINEIKEWANQNSLSTMNFFNDVKFSKKFMTIRDILEDNVDEKYFINNGKMEKFISSLEKKQLESEKNKKIIKLFDLPKDVHNDLERQRRVYSINGIAPTILARSDSPKIIFENKGKYFIRKLTPIETLKAQGFNQEYINNIKKNYMSDTQLYKQSGNAVSPPVISVIANLIKEKFEDGI